MTKANVEFPLMELGKDETMCRTMVLFLPSLDTKKCLNVEILSDKCQKWQKKENNPKYQEWKASRHCKINHAGRANSI